MDSRTSPEPPGPSQTPKKRRTTRKNPKNRKFGVGGGRAEAFYYINRIGLYPAGFWSSIQSSQAPPHAPSQSGLAPNVRVFFGVWEDPGGSGGGRPDIHIPSRVIDFSSTN